MKLEVKRDDKIDYDRAQAHDGPSNSWSWNVSRASLPFTPTSRLFFCEFSRLISKKKKDLILSFSFERCTFPHIFLVTDHHTRSVLAWQFSPRSPQRCENLFLIIHCFSFVCRAHSYVWRFSIYLFVNNNYTYFYNLSHTLTVSREIWDRESHVCLTTWMDRDEVGVV